MDKYLYILIYVFAGILLFWFGISLFLGKLPPFFPKIFSFKEWKRLNKKIKQNIENENKVEKGNPGDAQVCPLCLSKLIKSEQVKSVAFPSVSGGQYRMMHIRGCPICLNNNAPRTCPICKASLNLEDYLICRMFQRPNRKSHIHVLGCTRCRKT